MGWAAGPPTPPSAEPTVRSSVPQLRRRGVATTCALVALLSASSPATATGPALHSQQGSATLTPSMAVEAEPPPGRSEPFAEPPSLLWPDVPSESARSVAGPGFDDDAGELVTEQSGGKGLAPDPQPDDLVTDDHPAPTSELPHLSPASLTIPSLDLDGADAPIDRAFDTVMSSPPAPPRLGVSAEDRATFDHDPTLEPTL